MTKLWFGRGRNFELSNIHISSIKAPIPTDEVSMFKLIIGEHLDSH